MSTYRTNPSRWRFVALTFLAVLSALLAAACGSSSANLPPVDYTPSADHGFPVSTPEEEGLDPALLDEVYRQAGGVETIRSLLILKNGKLIGEAYFHGGSPDEDQRVQSVTKSYTSALTGLALQEGCLTSLDQPMMEFFPEYTTRARQSDRRKEDITIRHLLQMRAGYPWEESTPELMELLFTGFRPSNVADVPLVRDPGSGMEYSNLTTHLLGIVIARACDTDLKTFAEENLFGPLDSDTDNWIQDWEGYYLGFADMWLSPVELARFGQMYLDGGQFNGQQILPAEWIDESLEVYSTDAWPYRIGRNVSDMSYGYQWWQARAGDQHYNFAWGHGGQQVALVRDHDMVIVVTADPLYAQHGDEPWQKEKENLNLVGDFVASLPDA